MALIEELSHGIAQPFRDQQKQRIQRTFVSGSDAAEARLSRGKNNNVNQTNPQSFYDPRVFTFQHNCFLGPKRKVGKEDHNKVHPTKLPFCKYGNFVPASASDSHDEDNKNSELEKEEKEHITSLSKKLSSDDCQIIPKSISKPKELNAKGKNEFKEKSLFLLFFE